MPLYHVSRRFVHDRAADTIHAALGIGEQTQCCLNCRHYDQYYVRDHTRAAYFWPMNAPATAPTRPSSPAGPPRPAQTSSPKGSDPMIVNHFSALAGAKRMKISQSVPQPACPGQRSLPCITTGKKASGSIRWTSCASACNASRATCSPLNQNNRKEVHRCPQIHFSGSCQCKTQT